MVDSSEEERTDHSPWSEHDAGEGLPVKTDDPSTTEGAFDDILQMEIDPEDIVYLVKALTLCHNLGLKADWFTQVNILAERHPNDGLRVFCITERMRCMTVMAKDPRMKGWSLIMDDPHGDLTDGSVLKAIALAPLYVRRQKLRFDADEFFASVLAEVPSAGNA